MSDERGTCEERLPDQLAGRVEDLRSMVQGIESDDDEKREAAEEMAHSYGLGLSFRRVLRWDLSTGGPGDWLEFHVDDDSELARIEYVFQDWFDGARTTLEPGGEEYDAASDFYEYFLRPYVETH